MDDFKELKKMDKDRILYLFLEVLEYVEGGSGGNSLREDLRIFFRC